MTDDGQGFSHPLNGNIGNPVFRAMDVDSLAITVDIARFMLHFLNEASVCHLGGSMQPRMRLTAICYGMAG